MARIRTIKPEFFTSEDIVELDPMSRLLYIALWCEADKEGRFAWRPKTFKMRYFPADSCDIDAMCDALVTRGLVSLYGEGLAFIPSFRSHQHINPRESESKLPDPDQFIQRVDDASSRVSDEENSHREEGKGREGKGRNISSDKSLDVRGDADGPVSDGKHEKKKTLSCPHQKVIDLYHELLPTCPGVIEWNETRRGYLQSRWRDKSSSLGWQSEADGIEWFSRFFKFVSESDFLTGKSDGNGNRKPFVADLEWLLRPTNFAKVVEGKYHA